MSVPASSIAGDKITMLLFVVPRHAQMKACASYTVHV